MPLSKLKFAPGINRDMTDYTNTGGWYDSDKVRFRNGLPEKIGGWQRFLPNQFLGTAREMLRWSSLNSTIYTSVGTNLKVYINGGALGGLSDVTPIRRTTGSGTIPALSNPFDTTSGSSTVVVTDPGHGAITGDYVTFTGGSAVGGLTISGEYIITSVISSSKYTITASSNASSTANGGGAPVAAYQVNIGLDSLAVGTGWGVGPFGGANNPDTSTTLAANPISTTISSTTVTIARSGAAAAGYLAGDGVVISGVTGNPGGIDNKFFNKPISAVDSTGTPVTLVGGAFTITSVSTNSYTIEVGQAATSTVLPTPGSGGSAVVEKYYKQANSTGWGDPASGSSLTLQLRLWSFDNYGEDLIINPRDGGIYYWVENTAASRAVPLSTLTNASHVPGQASKILVTEIGKHVMAFGATPFAAGTAKEDTGTQNQMLIRFSSDERPEYWDETDTAENAGSIPLSNGSFIMTAEQTRQEILCWTDTALYSIQYQGAPYIFTASLLSSGTDILGPNVVATAVNTTFWMGSDNFYYYDGNVNRMPCTVREKVFPNLNFEQRYKVFASVNSAYNEIVWFYPSVAIDENGDMNTECDSYVTYNYAEKCWYYGTMPRTAWVDRGFGTNPVAASDDGYLYYHEVGADDGSENPSVAIPAYIISSPVEIEDGQKFGFINRIIPDVSFRQTGEEPVYTSPNPRVTFTLYPQNYPGGMPPLNSAGVPTLYYGGADSKAVKLNISGSATVFSGTASVSGSVLTVTAVTTGSLSIGTIVTGIGIPSGTSISSLGTGSGGIGTYNLSQSASANSGSIVGYSTIDTFTQQVFTRVRGRSVILRVESEDLGVQWRLGTPRLDIRLDGRR